MKLIDALWDALTRKVLNFQEVATVTASGQCITDIASVLTVTSNCQTWQCQHLNCAVSDK